MLDPIGFGSVPQKNLRTSKGEKATPIFRFQTVGFRYSWCVLVTQADTIGVKANLPCG